MPRIAIFEGYGAQGPPGEGGNIALMFGVAVLLAATLFKGRKRPSRRRRRKGRKRSRR